MGDEQVEQQRRLRISPETKEKIKKFAKRAGKIAGIAVVSGGIGAAIGASIQYGVSQRVIERMYIEATQRQCLTQYDLDQGEDAVLDNISEINGRVISSLSNEPEKIAGALKDVTEIAKNYWFGPKHLEVLRKIAEESGSNSFYAIRILATLSETGSNISEVLSEENYSIVVRAAGLLNQRGGEKAGEILAEISRVILASQKPQSPVQKIRLVEVALLCAANSEEATWNIEFISRAGCRVQDFYAHIEKIFDVVWIIKNMGGEYSAALNSLRELVTYCPATPNEQTSPEILLNAANYVTRRYANAERVGITLRIITEMAKKSKSSQNMDYGEYVCQMTDTAVAASGIEGMRTLRFIEKIMGNPGFEIGMLEPGLEAGIGGMVSGIYSRDFTNVEAAMEIINSMAASYYYPPSGQGYRMKYQLRQIIEVVKEFTANTPTMERLLHNLRTMNGMSNGHAEKMDWGAAAKLCELENYLYGTYGGGALVALGEMEKNFFSPALIRLVEIAIRGKNGAQPVISAIRALHRSINSATYGLGAVSYGDMEMADDMLVSMYRTERPPLERLVNFSYGISVLGPDKVRELNKTFGLEYFLRYEKDLLLKVGENVYRDVDSAKPVLLAVVGKVDWNGAFYSFGNTDLEKLTSHYKLLIAEVESNSEFVLRVNQIAGMYGDISALILGGHGSPASISLGSYGAGSGSLDFSDERSISMLMDSFVQNPLIILNSCSTGRHNGTIAGMLSRTLGAVVYAPTQDAGYSSYELDVVGRIVGVDYGVIPTRVYENGESRVVGNAE